MAKNTGNNYAAAPAARRFLPITLKPATIQCRRSNGRNKSQDGCIGDGYRA